MLEDFDLIKDRPFIKFSNNTISQLIVDCFKIDRLDLEIATLLYEELKLRKTSKSKTLLSEIELEFKKVNHTPIKWLKEAREKIKEIKNVHNKSKNLNSIYVILRNGYSIQNQTYGVYVGQTSKTPEQRFFEHKSGIKSARGLKKYGIQLLRSLWPYGKVDSDKKLCYETKLHLTLKKVVPKVSGDVKADKIANS